MKIAAIICEYNPFHNGHKYQIDEIRRICGEDTAVIALMSGNFVQRGDVAIYPKAVRANAAIYGGADLVLELPAIFSMQSAEFFAKNAVKILNSLEMVDFLVFGAETDNLSLIEKTAKLLAFEPADFSDNLNVLCSEGVSFPVARERIIGEFLGKACGNLLKMPNNILGIEYCKALFALDSSIKPLLIQRNGAMHHSFVATDNIASATHIRTLITGGNFKEARFYIPENCHALFENERVHSIKEMEKAIIGEIVKMPLEKLKNISDVGEGLENRIKEKTLSAKSFQELADSVKTKRYTHSRIRRILLSAYLGIEHCHRNAEPCYIKVLAHNENGQRLIKKAKASSRLPLVRNTSQINKLCIAPAKEMWERERIFDFLYSLF